MPQVSAAEVKAGESGGVLRRLRSEARTSGARWSKRPSMKSG